MKFYYLCFVLLSGVAVGNITNNVRVIDHASYMTKVVTETVRRVEQKGWWNLKVPDVEFDIDEVALTWSAKGTVHYKNGFVSSIQALDLLQSSVQSTVNLNEEKQAQAVIKGTLRMQDVAIGYDVQADLEDGTQYYTVVYVHPLINFVFSVVKIINRDEISVTVDSNVVNSYNNPIFMPRTKETEVFTALFNKSMSNAAINAWGADVFTPIAAEVVPRIEFPTFCYNCPA